LQGKRLIGVDKVDKVPDSFEALVEVYYQTKGYITSSNKWFWVRERVKSIGVTGVSSFSCKW